MHRVAFSPLARRANAAFICSVNIYTRAEASLKVAEKGGEGGEERRGVRGKGGIGEGPAGGWGGGKAGLGLGLWAGAGGWGLGLGGQTQL